MAKKKENLKEVSDQELAKKLLALETDLRMRRSKAEGAKSKDVKESSKIRKQIARVLTEINSR